MLEPVIHPARPQQAYFWATHPGAELDRLRVIYPGDKDYSQPAGVDVIPARRVAEFVE